MDETQYKQAKATILKAFFVDKLSYEDVSKLIKEKYGLSYEDIAYRMDEEGVFK